LGDWRHSTRIFRWLGRQRIAHPDWVLGPWTVRTLINLLQNKLDDDGIPMRSWLEHNGVPAVKWVIHGDDEVEQTNLEYEPSESDISNDTEVNSADDLVVP
jgi:hypothetical protein